jgi:hypothetical protein
MTDVRAEDLAGEQDGLVARWQLLRAGLSKAAVESWATGLRVLHDGVYLTGWGEVTQRQRWWGAVLTAPGTVLANASAAGLHGIRRPPAGLDTVVRVGTRGRRTEPGLLVSYSLTLATNIIEIDGLPVTTVERTIIDLWPHLPPLERVRMLREAFRLGRTTTTRMLAALRAHRGRRGVESLRAEVLVLGGLRLERCLSDAEAFAVAFLHEAGVEAPDVNERIAGHRADLSWPAQRLVIEIDGPSFHVLRDADILTMRRWEAAGHTVRRIPSDVLYADPSALLRLAPPAGSNVRISRL